MEESDHEEKELEEKDLYDLKKTLYSPPRQENSILHPRDDQNVAPADQSSGVIRFRQDRSRQPETKPPAQSRTMPQYSNVPDIHVQLQLRRLEYDHAKEQQGRERKERQQQQQQQFQLKKLESEYLQQLEFKKLELEMSRASDPFAHAHTDPPSYRPPPFRVEAAVKLVPKFSENDVETFLISFDKVAELSNFPPG